MLIRKMIVLFMRADISIKSLIYTVIFSGTTIFREYFTLLLLLFKY